MMPAPSFAGVLTRFFTLRLMQQRHASPHTVGSYRDTFRLLLRFATARTGKMAAAKVQASLIRPWWTDARRRNIATLNIWWPSGSGRQGHRAGPG